MAPFGGQESNAANDYESMVVQASKFESFKLDEMHNHINSSYLANRSQAQLRRLDWTQRGLVVAIALSVSAVGAGMSYITIQIHDLLARVVDEAMWSCDGALPHDHLLGAEHSDCATEARLGAALAAFVGLRLLVVLAATLLVFWQPNAAGSGLAQIKSFLNGTRIPGYLSSPAVLIAKALGTTLVVSTGLPLDKEAPLVHMGATISCLLSNVEAGWMRKLVELRRPRDQRNWIGLGAAAGLACAFQAPLGGILYSFEEVCSSWSGLLTWRSFVCQVIVALCSKLLLEFAAIGHSSFVLGAQLDDAHHSLAKGDFGWFLLIGLAGGAIGAGYTATVETFNHLRGRWLKGRPRVKVLEALTLSALVFALFFLAPLLTSCRELPSTDSSSLADSSSSSADGGAGTNGQMHLEYLRFNCPAGQHNEIATLLHGGQEGMLAHLFVRTEDEREAITAAGCGLVLLLYFASAVLLYGVALPSGNFIAAMVIGGLMGRLGGQWLFVAGYIDARRRGTYAIIGSAAVLGGMTHMSLTLSIILVEVTADVTLLPAIMFTLAVSRAFGSVFKESFDDVMLHVEQLPYLHEEPPPQLSVLRAEDVMSSPPRTLPLKAHVSQIVAALAETGHNGFPVVAACKVQSTHAGHQSVLCRGIVMRRQLEIILEERLWAVQQHRGRHKLPISNELSLRMVACLTLNDNGRSNSLEAQSCSWRRWLTCGLWSPSAVLPSVAGEARGRSGGIIGDGKGGAKVVQQRFGLSDADLGQVIDLHSVMDPGPFIVSKFAKVTRVYEMFNLLGVRHLPVYDDKQRLCGIITRKDMSPKLIEAKLRDAKRKHARAQQRLDAMARNSRSSHDSNSAYSGALSLKQKLQQSFQDLLDVWGGDGEGGRGRCSSWMLGRASTRSSASSENGERGGEGEEPVRRSKTLFWGFRAKGGVVPGGGERKQGAKGPEGAVLRKQSTCRVVGASDPSREAPPAGNDDCSDASFRSSHESSSQPGSKTHSKTPSVRSGSNKTGGRRHRVSKGTLPVRPDVGGGATTPAGSPIKQLRRHSTAGIAGLDERPKACSPILQRRNSFDGGGMLEAANQGALQRRNSMPGLLEGSVNALGICGTDTAAAPPTYSRRLSAPVGDPAFWRSHRRPSLAASERSVSSAGGDFIQDLKFTEEAAGNSSAPSDQSGAERSPLGPPRRLGSNSGELPPVVPPRSRGSNSGELSNHSAQSGDGGERPARSPATSPNKRTKDPTKQPRRNSTAGIIGLDSGAPKKPEC